MQPWKNVYVWCGVVFVGVDDAQRIVDLDLADVC